jgi:hypothetical protein
MKQTFQFVVTYTNDVRKVEIKASSEKQALEAIQHKAKKALMKILNIQTL